MTIQSEIEKEPVLRLFNIKIEPKHADNEYKIVVDINEHYSIDDNHDHVLGCNKIIDLLKNNWLVTLDKSKEIVESLRKELCQL